MKAGDFTYVYVWLNIKHILKYCPLLTTVLFEYSNFKYRSIVLLRVIDTWKQCIRMAHDACIVIKWFNQNTLFTPARRNIPSYFAKPEVRSVTLWMYMWTRRGVGGGEWRVALDRRESPSSARRRERDQLIPCRCAVCLSATSPLCVCASVSAGPTPMTHSLTYSHSNSHSHSLNSKG